MGRETRYSPVAGTWTEGDEGSPTWVVVDPDDLVDAAKRYGVSDQALVILEHHRPGAHPERGPRPLRGHVDRSADGELVLSVPTLSYVEETRDVLTGSLTCIVRKDVVITAELGQSRILPHALDKLTSGVPVPDDGVHEVLAAIMLTLVAQAGDVEASLGDAVADTEAVVFTSNRTTGDPLQRIYDLKREIAEARRALGPIASVVPMLAAETEQQHSRRHDARPWLRRTQVIADRLDRHLDTHDELLDAMLSVHLSQVSVRQNEDMRKISAWAAIAAVPTLIAGIYGMNFRHMPELDWTYGYPIVVVAMLVICGGLYARFRKSGWL
ncbi:magnesium and cobalt transport protein CorA [Cellulomonas rhizosphaerae]|uniref:magnesium and cobalt transport protein CorA n=1 Tax=Cellulomonas rhizosphaerae TaxID=2293719 RepID=UPI001F332DF5|nr:magnesium and cobalt transport protein CorA [Cellulomonas rhizosphaerae]